MTYGSSANAKGGDVKNQRCEREPSERFSRLRVGLLNVEKGSQSDHSDTHSDEGNDQQRPATQAVHKLRGDESNNNLSRPSINQNVQSSKNMMK